MSEENKFAEAMIREIKKNLTEKIVNNYQKYCYVNKIDYDSNIELIIKNAFTDTYDNDVTEFISDFFPKYSYKAIGEILGFKEDEEENRDT